MPSDLTEARRERTRELWGKSDRKIAEKLLEEGFHGPVSRNREEKIRQIASLRRTVWNDREFWREKWRTEAKAEKSKDPVSRQEYLAGLETVQDELEDVISDGATKSTPRVQALSEMRQIKQAIGKALGVDAAPPAVGGEDAVKPIVVGLLIGTENVSEEARGKLKEQGIDI